ncbi:MAG TPA: hypothetical protein VKG02_24305 [Blastocatellia bacterium]|nr:hypothetical protein [Blastocatellia bacterium]
MGNKENPAFTEEPDEIYSVEVYRAGGEYGPAVSVYHNGRLTEFLELYYFVVALRSPRRTVLINTGMPEDFSAFDNFVKEWHPECRLFRAPEETTPQILARAGIDPAGVKTVILTPLTIYTTGNVSLFSNARFAVSRVGWVDFWAPEPHAPRLPKNIAAPAESRRYFADEAFDRMQLLDKEDVICPGVTCFYTGGHHLSSMAVSVQTERGKVILGDCFFTYDNLEKNIPIGWAENLHEINVAYDRVRRSADIAVPLYDPQVFQRYPGGKIA